MLTRIRALFRTTRSLPNSIPRGIAPNNDFRTPELRRKWRLGSQVECKRKSKNIKWVTLISILISTPWKIRLAFQHSRQYIARPNTKYPQQPMFSRERSSMPSQKRESKEKAGLYYCYTSCKLFSGKTVLIFMPHVLNSIFTRENYSVEPGNVVLFFPALPFDFWLL